MGTYILRRLLLMVPVIIGATFLIYAMVFAMPGDPLAGRCGERPCPPAFAAKFREQHHLNDPLPVQYAKYMGQLAQGDLGETFQGVKVSEELSKRYPITIRLAVIAILVELVIGVFAGVLAGIRKGKFVDNLVLVSTLIVIAIPTFVIGVLARKIFGLDLGWFRPTVSPAAPWSELILPGIVLGAISLVRRSSDSDQFGGEPQGGLRANCRGQGAGTTSNDWRAYPAQLVDPGGHLCWCRLRGTVRRRDHHRAHLQHPGGWWLHLPKHPQP